MTEIFESNPVAAAPSPSDIYYHGVYIGEIINCLPSPDMDMSAEFNVVAAARTSFMGKSGDRDKDKKLFLRLYKDVHTSPFEAVEFVIKVQLSELEWRVLTEDMRYKVTVVRDFDRIDGTGYVRMDLNNAIKMYQMHRGRHEKLPYLYTALDHVFKTFYPWSCEILGLEPYSSEMTYTEPAKDRRYLLDKGWIDLVDCNGTDDKFAELIRQEYPEWSHLSTEDVIAKYVIKLPEDHRLLALFSAQILIHAPMVVFWQWTRHRSWSFSLQCLSGDTEITFNKPDKLKKGILSPYKMKLSDLYSKWISNRRNQYPLEDMNIRVFDEDKGNFTSGRIKNVYLTGKKHGFKVKTNKGYEIVSSEDHRFLFEDGWKTLKEATGLEYNGKRVTWTNLPKLYTNGIKRLDTHTMYDNHEWLKENYIDKQLSIKTLAIMANCSMHTIRKYLKKYSLTSIERSIATRFSNDKPVWNKGLHYSFSFNEEQKKAWGEIAKSNWKNRKDREPIKIRSEKKEKRSKIRQWMKDISPKVYKRDNYTCQYCGEVSRSNDKLHAHHIVPVWVNNSDEFSMNENNLITVHASCHRLIHKRNEELSFAKSLNNDIDFDQNLKKSYTKKNFRYSLKLRPKLSQIISIEYVGEIEMYDIEIDTEYKNFVANNFVVHNSGRYMEFKEDQFHTPKTWRKQSKSNKQGSDGELSEDEGSEIIGDLDDKYHWTKEPYNDLINNGGGLNELYKRHLASSFEIYESMLKHDAAKEQARLFLPAWGSYYHAMLKVDLLSMQRFLRLRMASDAQYEIRVFAEALFEKWKAKMPITAREIQEQQFLIRGI